MNKIIITILVLYSSVFANEIWVDDIATLYYAQKNINNTTVEAKKVTQDKILRLSCLKGGTIFELEDKKLRDDCDAIFMELKKVYYTKTPFGTKETSKDKTKMPLKSFESFRTIKKIYNHEVTKLFDAPLELSFASKPKKIKVGDRIGFIVSSFGKVKAGVNITYNKKIVAKSNKDGYVSIEIKKLKNQNITASYSKKGDGIKCDETLYSTTLNMEVFR